MKKKEIVEIKIKKNHEYFRLDFFNPKYNIEDHMERCKTFSYMSNDFFDKINLYYSRDLFSFVVENKNKKTILYEMIRYAKMFEIKRFSFFKKRKLNIVFLGKEETILESKKITKKLDFKFPLTKISFKKDLNKFEEELNKKISYQE